VQKIISNRLQPFFLVNHHQYLIHNNLSAKRWDSSVIEALVEEGILLPSKFIDYVKVGRPILAISPPVGTLADILNEIGGEIAINGRSAEMVADAIQVMYESWINGTLDYQFGSEKLLPLYSSETIMDHYQDSFKVLLKDC